MYSFEDKSVISLDNIEMEALYNLLMAMVDTDDPDTSAEKLYIIRYGKEIRF